MQTAELYYHLPGDHIATSPAEPRDAARLMIVDRRTGSIAHRHVRDLGEPSSPLRPGDLMIFNQTRVIRAHFTATRTQTAGRITGLYLGAPDDQSDHWHVMLEARGKLRQGETISLTQDAHLELVRHVSSGQWIARLYSDMPAGDLLNYLAQPPLPPYIRRVRKARGEDEIQPTDYDRYNTVFAMDPGSIAAPTAALHFTRRLFNAIEHLGVGRATLTLHIGLGTFAPVRHSRLQDHMMHEEWMHVSRQTLSAIQETRRSGGRIIPVGTTCVRALESLPAQLPDNDYVGRTDLFITPPDPQQPAFPFRFTDALMTNFHLPQSTLLALVAALPHVGIDQLKAWYHHAIAQDYRFYSYGDAMLLL